MLEYIKVDKIISMGAKLLSLCVLLLILMLGSTESKVTKGSNPNPNPNPNRNPNRRTEFIKSSCKATRYPGRCVESLLGYASSIGESEQELAMTAVSVSVSKTRSCAWLVKKMGTVKGMKPREWNAVRDCTQNMDDSLDRLNQSLRELGLVRKPKGKGKGNNDSFMWHVSNVQTWLSAAITDHDTCLDAFAVPHFDSNLKAAITPSLLAASQLTSNALALVNRFASNYPTASQPH